MTQHFQDITPDLVERLDLRAAAEDYDRRARAARIIADNLHKLGLPYEDFDTEAAALAAQAADVRRYLSQ